MPLLILPEVFNPTLFGSSELLVRLLPEWVCSGASVLDMGTGSGASAIAAARLGARVVAVDISPHALRCTRINALLNGVEHLIDVREGDLFSPLNGEQFDLVLFNPPYFHGEPSEPWEIAWRSTHTLDRFARGLPSVLLPGGRALLAVSTETHSLADVLAHHAVHSRVVAHRSFGSEHLMVQEWTFPQAESAP
jgi:release factor glutamine methyltransferase